MGIDGYNSACVVRCGPGVGEAVAVDTWRVEGCSLYICTHAHADHTVGLDNAWCRGAIACSAQTRALLLLKWPALGRHITALPLDETTTLHLGRGALPLAVTPFDSEHCPGSTAFLLEAPLCGRVLHTGDWRRSSPLPPRVLSAPLDTVYLDNTFCHPSYAHPPREQALRLLLEHVTAWREGSACASDADGAACAAMGGRLLLGVDALGKEEVLEAVAAAAGGRVAVTMARLASARALGLPTDHLTTYPDEAAVLTSARYFFGASATGWVRPPHVASGAVPPATVALLPTGWPSEKAAPGSPAGLIRYTSVPYSLHAPFSELRALMETLRPVAVIGLVASPRFSDRPIDPVLHFQHLLRPELARPPPPPQPPQPPPPPALRPLGGPDESPGSMLARMRHSAASFAMQAACTLAAVTGGRRRRGLVMPPPRPPKVEAGAAGDENCEAPSKRIKLEEE